MWPEWHISEIICFVGQRNSVEEKIAQS